MNTILFYLMLSGVLLQHGSKDIGSSSLFISENHNSFKGTSVLLSPLLCTGILGENVLNEGDFGSGTPNVLAIDPEIAPGYEYDASPPPNNGFYTITNNTSSWGSFASTWINIGDNSPDDNGYMMVVNASFDPGIFYKTTLNVCENTTYEFLADIVNLVSPTHEPLIQPNVDFLIDNVVMYSSGDIAQNGQWNQYGFTFTTSSTTSSIQLTLRNNAPGGLGNDLALDNISFRACGPEAFIAPIDAICQNGTLVLNVELGGSQFDTPFFKWITREDGGNWMNVPSANGDSLIVSNPVDGTSYRFLLANSSDNISNPVCRIVSLPITLQVDYSESFITESICGGSSYNFGANVLTEGGIYSETLTNSAGCDSIITLELLVEDSTLQITTINLCEGETYNGQEYSEDTTLTKVFTTFNGCDSTVVTSISVLNAETFSINGPLGICDGSSAVLDAGSFEQFLWSTGETTATITIDSPGTYAVSVTNQAGCSASNAIEISGNGISVEVEIISPNCDVGSTGSIEVVEVMGGAGNYLFGIDGQPLQEVAIFEGLFEGSYTLFVEDDTGCSYEGNVSVIIPEQLTVSLGQNFHITIGESAQLNATTNKPLSKIQWITGGEISCTDCSDPIATPDITTTYSVEVSDLDGCLASDSIIIFVDKLRKVYIPNVFSPNGDGINDLFYISTGEEVLQIKALRIFDRWGGLVYENENFSPNDPNFGWDGKYNKKPNFSGVYVYYALIAFQDEKELIYEGDITLVR